MHNAQRSICMCVLLSALMAFSWTGLPLNSVPMPGFADKAYAFEDTDNSDLGDDYGNACADATLLEVPESYADTGTFTVTAAGVLEAAGDLDYFSITLPDPGTIQLFTTGGTDTYGYLKDSSCTTIRETKDSESVVGNFSMTKKLDEAGTFYIGVRQYFGDKTGPYTLNVTFTKEQEDEDDDEPAACPAAYLLERDDPCLAMLRQFRDEVLAGSAMGREMIRLYYAHADAALSAMRANPELRRAARQLLNQYMSLMHAMLGQ